MMDLCAREPHVPEFAGQVPVFTEERNGLSANAYGLCRIL
jgi:hypothetical protein